MTKNLLFIASAMALAVSGSAQTRVYATDELGEVNSISPNGQYAAVTDTENHIAYLWQQDKPEQWLNITPVTEDASNLPSSQVITGADVYGVSNDGMVVGSILYKNGAQKPAIYRNGEWEFLPMHAASRNTNEAVAVTWDGKVIAGYMFINDADGDIPGHYYPCRWTLNGDGEYDLTAYTEIELPHHQGFYPLTMTPDGKIIAGEVFIGVSSLVPAWVTSEGELHITVDFEERYEPWIYKGKYYCGMEDGKQVWSDDPDDPRIVLFEETYIDGVKDTNEEPWNGAFAGCDWNGNLYGMRTVASDVNLEEGTGTLTNYATMYNLESGEWKDYSDVSMLITGLEGKIIFAQAGYVINNGELGRVSEEYGIVSERTLTAISHTSSNGQVLGGVTEQTNPASGELQYYPLIAILDNALVETPENPDTGIGDNVGIDEVVMTTTVAEPVVLVDGRRINVSNAAAAAVYDLEGRLVGSGKSVSVAAGVYVVKADNVTRKIIVK